MLAFCDTEKERRLVAEVLRIMNEIRAGHGAAPGRMMDLEMATVGHEATRLHLLVSQAMENFQVRSSMAPGDLTASEIIVALRNIGWSWQGRSRALTRR